MKRITMARIAINTFAAGSDSDREDLLCDLLTDLMHWADRDGLDFFEEYERAKMHYTEEAGQ